MFILPIHNTLTKMLKTITIILIGLFISFELIAQSQQKEWREGKLQWEDFTGEIGSKEGAFEFKYMIGYSTGKQKYGDTSVVRNTVECYMVKDLSWIKPNFKTDQYLRYNQVIFDIVEIHKRKIQKAFDNVESTDRYDRKFVYYHRQLNSTIDEFRSESNSGKDTNIISIWENKISQELNYYGFQEIPNYENGEFGYGLWVGLGTGFSTGSLGDHFSPIYSLVYGFEASYGLSMVFLNVTLAGSKIKQDYLTDSRWSKGSKVGVAIGDLSYGYTLINDDKYKITPFIGIGVIEHSIKDPANETKTINMTDFKMSAGLSFDYKIATRVNLIPEAMFGIREKTETSIRARLYVTRARYYGDMKGLSINFAIGICGFGNAIKIK